MRSYQTLKFHTDNDIATIQLNATGSCPTLSHALIEEMEELCQTITKLTNIRAVILSGAGDHFCQSMSSTEHLTHAKQAFNDNKKSATRIGAFFHMLSTLPQPLIGVAHGHTTSDGIGLLASCDVVFADENATFQFDDVTRGLIPSLITPYIIRKIGYSHARALFTTAEIINALTAQRIGLIHHCTKQPDLLGIVTSYCEKLKRNGQQAVAQSKQLVDQFFPVEPQMVDFTAELLAHCRVGDEAQQALKADKESK